ncbi:oxidoreductase [Clostridia bacterium]|nr:oxidoreductase [Clostridia bacterium]
MAKYKVILAGCGGMSWAWIEYLRKREDVEILAFVDIIIERAVLKNTSNNLSCAVFDDIRKALAALPEANLVIDTTSPDAHELIVTSALNAGKNVLGEKPMAETREQALNEIACADKAGKTYSVMQNRIYLPGMRTIRRNVDNGLLGRLGSISSDFFIEVHFGGFRDLMDNVLVLDMAIHTFYQARFLIGEPSCTSVYCQEFNPPWSWYKGNASAVAIFEFDNGVVYDYRGSWCPKGHFDTSWECDWRIIGEKGTIKWEGSSTPIARLDNGDEIKLGNTYNGKNGHEGCFDEMFAALEEGRAAETDSHRNYHAMNMVYGAIESAKTGKKVLL